MVTIRRQAITLLEMILVIAILAMASGIVAISINKAVVDQRFRTEVGLIVDELRLAQDLMLILGTDVHVHFSVSKDGNSIDYWLELETKLPENIQREVARKRAPLKTVKGVFLVDGLLNEEEEKHIDIKFLSQGAVMSRGVMRLATSDDERVPKGTLENFICLAGYPKPILSSETKEEAEKLCLKFENGLDERLTQDTISKLPEHLKKPDPSEVNPSSDVSGEKQGDNKKNQPAEKK